MVVYYKSARDYIQSRTTLESKITAIQAIIDNMILLIAAAAIDGSAIQADYELDNGQTKIKCNNRSIADMTKSITALQQLQWQFINQKEGRMTRLSDQANFRPKSGYNNGI